MFIGDHLLVPETGDRLEWKAAIARQESTIPGYVPEKNEKLQKLAWV